VRGNLRIKYREQQMIIKSLSRKTATFNGLFQYFHKENDAVAPSYCWNMYAQTRESAVSEFEENAGWLTKRKNGVILYHEIISIKKQEGIPPRILGAILKDIVHQYVIRRCPDQMVYGKMHMVGHPHFHLCISANAPGRSRRCRLPKADLARIKREVETYAMEYYPQLEWQNIHNKTSKTCEKVKQTRHERERSKRTQILSRKEQDRHVVMAIFRQSKTEMELNSKLEKHGFKLYVRGQTEGVIANDGRKYRLKTLGLESEFQSTKKRQKVYTTRRVDLESMKQSHEINRERS